MKTTFIGLLTLGLSINALYAQESSRYYVYIVGKNGKVVEKTYEGLAALKSDADLQGLKAGATKNNVFDFTPSESRHKLFFVEELGGAERHFIFEAWDAAAVKEFEKTTKVETPIPDFAESGTNIPAPARKEGQDHRFLEKNGDGTFEEKFITELQKDGLIKTGESFHIKLTKQYFLLNGKEQNKEVSEKYQKFVESARGEKLDTAYVFEYSVE